MDHRVTARTPENRRERLAGAIWQGHAMNGPKTFRHGQILAEGPPKNLPETFGHASDEV